MLGVGVRGEGFHRTFMPSSPLTAGAQLSPTDIEGIETTRRFAAAEEASAGSAWKNTLVGFRSPWTTPLM